MKNKEKVNYNLVNIIKFIFSILVIASHTKLATNISNVFLKNTLSILINCAVPFFFLCMGYSLSEKIDFINCNDKQLKRIKIVLLGIVKKYLYWSLIYFPLALVEYLQTKKSFIYNFLSYIKGLFFKGEHYNSWMLWYLLSFIYAFGFIYYCLKKNIKFKSIGIMSLSIGSLSIVLKYSSLYDFNFSLELLNNIVSLIQLVFGNGRIFTGFIYIYLGILIYYLKNKHLVICGMFVVSAFCFVCGSGVMRALGILFLSILIFLLSISIKLNNKSTGIYENLRDISTTNYYVHMYVYTIYYYVVYKIPTYTIDCFVYTALLTCVVSITYLLIKKHDSIKLF